MSVLMFVHVSQNNAHLLEPFFFTIPDGDGWGVDSLVRGWRRERKWGGGLHIIK